MLNIWVDDIRTPPSDYNYWCKSVNDCIRLIDHYCGQSLVGEYINIINLDHDAGDYYKYGGDYIKILEYLEEHYPNNNITFYLHTQNPVGRYNMENIIYHN